MKPYAGTLALSALLVFNFIAAAPAMAERRSAAFDPASVEEIEARDIEKVELQALVTIGPKAEPPKEEPTEDLADQPAE